MVWECSECGAWIELDRPPTHCPSCGLAGIIFCQADAFPEDEEGGVLGAWFEAGLEAGPTERRLER